MSSFCFAVSLIKTDEMTELDHIVLVVIALGLVFLRCFSIGTKHGVGFVHIRRNAVLIAVRQIVISGVLVTFNSVSRSFSVRLCSCLCCVRVAFQHTPFGLFIAGEMML